MSIFIGTEQGVRTLDGGADRLAGQPITAMSGQWALVGDHKLVSLSSGTEVRFEGPGARCLLDTGERLYVGTAEARLLAGPSATADGLVPVESFDHIETRDEWYTPWGAPPDTRSLAAAGIGILLVNVHVGGVWRQGVGDRWTEVISVESDTHQVTADADQGSVVAAAAVGFGRSFDGGETWDWTANGLHATYCRAVAIAGGTSLVTASTGPGSRRGAVYRRPLRGDGSFEKCEGGLPEWFPFNLDTAQLAASGDEVVLGTADGRVFRSADAGATWELIAENLPPVRTVSVR
jgi:hypothetical protein